MIPMKSWTGNEDIESFAHLYALEEYLGKEHAVVVDSVQHAVQLCLEILGTRAHMIPVGMSVSTSIETFAGVLWSGACPILLDTDTETYQIEPSKLQELLEDVESAVIVLEQAGGRPVAPSVLEAVQDVPTISVCRHAPTDLDALSLDATFNIFDLSETVGRGAVIYHKYDKQTQELKMLRGGPLGHRYILSGMECVVAQDRLERSEHRRAVQEATWNAFNEELNSRECDAILLWEMSDLVGPLYFYVPNAARTALHLESYGIPCRRMFYPLNKEPRIALRMKEGVEYPGAEYLHRHIVCIPSHSGVRDIVPLIVDRMVEILGDEDGRSPSGRDDSQGRVIHSSSKLE